MAIDQLAADLEAANAALAQRHGLTVADAIAQDGSWGAFCWWAMCQSTDEVASPGDDLSAHERYRLMCAVGWRGRVRMAALSRRACARFW